MNKQDYRKIEFTTKETFILKNNEITTYKLKGYKNVYVSNTCHIKPKGLHIILKNVNEALRDFKINDHNLKVIITSYQDDLNNLGLYDAINNEICLDELISDKNKLIHEKVELGHVERHEAWHLKQATIYRNKHGTIDKNNYLEYIAYTNMQAKRYLDSLGVNEDNVGVITEYAYNAYMMGRYDETEAEIKAMKGGAQCIQIFQKKFKNY